MRPGQAPAERNVPTPSIEWSIHLARRRPRQAAGAIGLIVLGAAAAGFGFGSALLGGLAAILLVASVSDYLFPLRFALTEAGAEARGALLRRRIAWSQVRRARRDHLGVKLSPLPRHSRLDAYRGIYLWFEGNDDDVMSFIAHHVRPEAVGGVDLSSV